MNAFLSVEGKKYRIFEPKWKEVILLWIGRNHILQEEKEKFVKALVKFKDGCNDFYQFKDCSLGDEIVTQIIDWGKGSNREKHLDPMRNTAGEI
ncbi:hypothetical protein [Cyanothece sp. BG0011]|uniref:hypothetical protein n=1 Tax=Cyanothece sp. BG0011 TaxID=2082950 RepID=UPI000D1F214B|nr:hypothetical protein [Cyanothece sp. BG0011]